MIEKKNQILRKGIFDRASANSSNRFSLRNCLIRDIESLLNNSTRSASLELNNYTFVQDSVLNYGIPLLSQKSDSKKSIMDNAVHIKKIIEIYEPRMEAKYLNVTPVLNKDYNHILAVIYRIDGLINLSDYTEALSFSVALDYSCGAFNVVD